MTFQGLQDNLREELSRRIRKGRLTGMRLAQATDFEQAHISNFLNHKRGLSIKAMDKVLEVEKLSILDLLDPAEVSKRATIPPPPEEGFENVLLVDADTAAGEPLVRREQVRDIYKFKRAFLRRLKPEMEIPRGGWTRFVLVRMGPESSSMYPRIAPGATVLIDRHYNSLRPYRRGEPNMYAVRKDAGLTVKYVEIAGKNLILRPHHPRHRIEIVEMEAEAAANEYLIGRVCYVGIEV